MEKRKKITPLPEWMKRQFELADKKIRNWSPEKQKWAGVMPSTLDNTGVAK